MICERSLCLASTPLSPILCGKILPPSMKYARMPILKPWLPRFAKLSRKQLPRFRLSRCARCRGLLTTPRKPTASSSSSPAPSACWLCSSPPLAYTVSRRTRDIGIRLALGAEQGNVLWQVLRETLVLVLLGIIIGVPLALGGTHLVRSMLFGLGFADPVAILFAATLLTIVAALAGFLPAWRASQVDPMVALRYE